MTEGKFPGFDSDTNTTEDETLTDDEFINSEEFQESIAFFDKKSKKTDVQLTKGIQDKIHKIRDLIKEVEGEYRDKIYQKITSDSKKIWAEQDYIEQIIRDKEDLPTVHIKAKHKHLHNPNTKMFMKISGDIRNSLELLFTYL
jgi:hypothetical protein